MKVWVYAICKNEARYAVQWADSMREADGVSVLDTGSVDDTVSLLRENGVQVTETRIEPWRFDRARNESLRLVPEDTDICVCTDLDEVFHPGWRAAAEAAWQDGVNQLRYRYTWNFNPDGSEGYVFYIEKMHARHGFRWVGPVHEVLSCDRVKQATAKGVQLDHHADPNKSRASYLPLLELAVSEDPENDRNCHYLGREYMFYSRWDDAIRTLKRHLSLKTAVWRDERCASMRYIARCLRAKGEEDDAERWLLRAAAEAPYLREPWLELAELELRRGDYHGTAFAASRALSVRERPETYISEARAWGALPYDLLSLGLYYTGDSAGALKMLERALEYAPNDERLLRNRSLIGHIPGQEAL